MSCDGLSCYLLSCDLLRCVVSCAYVYAYVHVVSMRTLRICVFIITVRDVGGAGPRADAMSLAFCLQGMLTLQTTKHCILSIQKANFVTQYMPDPMFDKSKHVIQNKIFYKASRTKI